MNTQVIVANISLVITRPYVVITTPPLDLIRARPLSHSFLELLLKSMILMDGVLQDDKKKIISFIGDGLCECELYNANCEIL